jgi:hypothetical protein
MRNIVGLGHEIDSQTFTSLFRLGLPPSGVGRPSRYLAALFWRRPFPSGLSADLPSLTAEAGKQRSHAFGQLRTLLGLAHSSSLAVQEALMQADNKRNGALDMQEPVLHNNSGFVTRCANFGTAGSRDCKPICANL